MSPGRLGRAVSRATVLPVGLRICETCGDPRGTTPDGAVAACWCSGLVCNRCGGRARRPITDYFDPKSGSWVHVPYFSLMAHRCVVPPGRTPGPKGWTHLTPDPDVVAYQEAVTELALAELRAGDELEIVDEDRLVGQTRLGEG